MGTRSIIRLPAQGDPVCAAVAHRLPLPRSAAAWLLLLLACSLLAHVSPARAQSRAEDRAREPVFMMVPNKDPQFLASGKSARRALPAFRELVRTGGRAGRPAIKTYLRDGERGVWLWLLVQEVWRGGFVAEPFEVPDGAVTLKVGQRLWVPNARVSDWMVNQDGLIHGGYSLRLQRERLPDEKKAWFDQHVGALRYAPLPD